MNREAIRNQRRSQKQRRHSEKRERIAWHITTRRVSLICLILLVPFSAMEDSTTPFERAVADPNLREAFVARTVERFPPPSNVEKVAYGTIEDAEKVAGPELDHAASMIAVSPEVEEGQKHIFQIFAFPKAFSGKQIRTDEDFVGALLHEYDHAYMLRDKGFMTQIRGFVPFSEFRYTELHKPIAELYATQRELQRITQNNSQTYLKTIQQRYIELYVKLWDSKGILIEESLRSDLKVEFFPLFLFREEEIQGSFGIMRDDGVHFDLTPEEIRKLKDRIRQSGGESSY